MALITVFTPTYNRIKLLTRLYESLCNQNNKDFIWLIVDDGSTDDTEAIVLGWILENKVNIKYFKQDNRGKMAAHNKGVLNCETQYFVCVDSDDFLVDTAIDSFYANFALCDDDKKCCGMIAYKTFNAKSLPGIKFPNKKYSTLTDLYSNGFVGETTLIFKTEILKNYLFPIINGEKFISEEYVYNQLDHKYYYYLLGCFFTIIEYQNDGYSKNIIKFMFENPKGYMLISRQKADLSSSYIEYFIHSYHECGYKRLQKDKLNLGIPKYKFIYFVAYITSIIFKYRLVSSFKKYENRNK